MSGLHKAIMLCCCEPGCCQCNRSAEVCCYHVDDILTLVVSRTYSPPRRCYERCGSSNALTCDDCVDYLDSVTYTLSICDGETLEFTRVGDDDCFPKWIRRTCGEDEWVPYDDDDNEVPWESVPLCPTCTIDCQFDPMLCGAIDPCDETLTCCSSGESDMASPPSPYTTCTHDDGDPVGGTGYCLCSGSGCYHFDLKVWSPICYFEETGGEGSCLGDGTEALGCIVTEISFTIENHCQDDGEGGCEAVPL